MKKYLRILGLESQKNFNILPSKAVKYIQFEEMMVASMIIYRTCERKGWLEETKRKTNGSVGRIGRPPPLDIETTNPLIFLRSTLFKSVSIRCSAKRRSSFPRRFMNAPTLISLNIAIFVRCGR